MKFRFFYKKMNIDWVLCEFYEPNTTRIINKILQKTKETSIVSYGNLLCRNKRDLKIIYKILLREYKVMQKEKRDLPNLFEESINQFLF